MNFPLYSSEIFPIYYPKTKEIFHCFKLNPPIIKEVGNRLSYHFSKHFHKQVIVTYFQGQFYTVCQNNYPLPEINQWQLALDEITNSFEDLQDFNWQFELIENPSIKPQIIADLAYQILRINYNLPLDTVNLNQDIAIEKVIKFWSEVVSCKIDGKKGLSPALSFTIKSNIVCRTNLAQYCDRISKNSQDLEKILLNLEVENIDSGSNAVIKSLAGIVRENGESLLKKAKNERSKKALEEALKYYPDQPLVAVSFGNSKKEYHYAMSALRPVMNAENLAKLGFDYGQILKHTKLNCQQRQNLIINFKNHAITILNQYQFNIIKSFSSGAYQDLFFTPTTPINEVKLLLGNNIQANHKDLSNALKKEGVYKYHSSFANGQKPVINISVLKLSDFKLNPFLNELEKQLNRHKFQLNFIRKQPFDVNKFQGQSLRIEVEKIVDNLIVENPDLILVILPDNKQINNEDEEDERGFYGQIYSEVLKHGIASQFIRENTLKKTEANFILSQVIPGILAKLGNLPFVLAEPITIADYILGLDVSRVKKKNVSGTMNACASIRLYGQRGEFLGYHSESDFLEGEEIPKPIIEKLLPVNQFAQKRVLIYRDGLFRGNEVKNLLERASAMDSRLILVECPKSGNPRLYEVKNKQLFPPPKGLAMKLNPQEAIAVTTQVSDKIGLARPLRLKIRSEGEIVAIEDIIETTLKLTLLHHGASKTTRLPLPLYGADKMAYLRIKGIYPRSMEGDRQFWL